MYRKEAAEAYAKALREGLREGKDAVAGQRPCHPAVLDDLLPEGSPERIVDMGLLEIPLWRVIGTKSAGRVSAFTRSFRPLLDADSEFAMKWISLCADHLSDVGIRDPIVCYEYEGNFYVQEGNKRVSVLRHFGALRIPAQVKRILPPADDSPRWRAYQEFLEFYRLTGLYDLQFTTPGSYARLLEKLDCPPQLPWTESQRRRFQSAFSAFRESLGGSSAPQLPPPEEALLLWLEVHPFTELNSCTPAELKKSIARLWPNLLAVSAPEPLVKTTPPGEKGKITQLLKGSEHLTVAFIHRYHANNSLWTQAHEEGRRHLEQALGKAITTRSYFDANTPEQAEALIRQAVADGADVLFTTSPQLIGASLKASVAYPRLRVLNCSVHQPYASVDSYYCRIYEGKFITGAIAGAMSKDGRIGYVGSYPIYGVPASINAFALGVQMTNPRARIELKWSCLPGNPTHEFLEQGIRVISNRDTPVASELVNEYGTYLADTHGQLITLGSPTWVWGRFYESVVRRILSGSWEAEKAGTAVNHWWGMDSGVIDVALSAQLPEGVRALAALLKDSLCRGTLDPFARRITDQQGRVMNDGSGPLSPMALLNMDWLCENVVGAFPRYEDILPQSRPMVDILGVSPSRGNTALG